ncbi:photosystem II high light acclimation radical SAM protein [Anabaena sp. FACHB-709]|uniref:Radical SAM domain-containing protein n=2 Tax=Nostocaceae TaxID=1162 RepID=A0A1Z4KM11_ANAVA|nr:MULTISPECIES: photosystem II high light acclimation radical SAM protein [Nostocaceae]BAY69923.1 radical SAM domain-containing protein [Trichormus variabilis NIES-23]HBW33393.1 radical SAM protein [Nostoc sp. UBA8866]MBD2173621.1 B12-binding domain-containing radical SAM protein [Anabaena cylindrica FACHB-318]MBD2265300.1 B12-binding domain-containing radical SAM protein [Anabaena sp. FACHB-709]MBD2275292.1 B12-binding domain-containing radical SAM protein [Nostoc sp. PCC 7120 = FACHB-418]
MEVKTPMMENRILYVRLPCNPIFPIGVVYLSDHVHKMFPNIEQRIFDLGTVPPLDYASALDRCIDEFQPTLLVFSWRDIQIYAPVGGRGGNPLQNAFEFYYAKNPLIKLRGALGGLRIFIAYYVELWRNLGLIKRGLKRAAKYHPDARVVVGGGAVSVFYEQLGKSLPNGTIISVGEGETLLEKFLSGKEFRDERCYVVGEAKPRQRLIHEQPTPLEKSACNYDYIERIWPEFNYYLQEQDFYIGVQTKRGCPHNCCYCVYTVVEGKQVRINPADEVVAEIRQLYNRGIRNFWFTDAQFIPARKFIDDAVELLQKIVDSGMTDIHWAAYIRADNLTPELCELMAKTGMNYFEIGITSGSQELVRKMRMGYNLRTVLQNCRDLKAAGFNDMVSVNYSFNVIDERPETIRQTIAYHRELEKIFGADKVEPAIFFIGLQPHTHLEEYAFKEGVLKPGYNPMSLMPWTAKKLLWNPEPLGSFFGEVCLQAWRRNPNDFGREVMNILEERLGCADLEAALSAPIETKDKQLVGV